MHEASPSPIERDIVDRLCFARFDYDPDVSSLDDLRELLDDARAEILRLRGVSS